MRDKLDLSAYFIVGPENAKGRRVAELIRAAVAGGFTCVQLRAKETAARDLLTLAAEAAGVIAGMRKADEVKLLINDRLDVALAAREAGIKIDGVHMGQGDIPVSVCRKYLGPEAIIGLSAPVRELLGALRSADMGYIDYLGAAPYHETTTKKDLERDEQGRIITQTEKALRELAAKSPLPIVVGGGVKLPDLAGIKALGAAGFFVITALTEAEDTEQAARAMVREWKRG